jgi:hypothetical protein
MSNAPGRPRMGRHREIDRLRAEQEADARRATNALISAWALNDELVAAHVWCRERLLRGGPSARSDAIQNMEAIIARARAKGETHG